MFENKSPMELGIGALVVLFLLGLGATALWSNYKWNVVGRPECNAGRFCNETFEKCEEGRQSSCAALANFYEKGRYGVPQDMDKSIEIHDRLCTERRRTSCLILARFYEEGRGVERDLERARGYVGQSCGSGAVDCFAVGKFMLRNHEEGGYDKARIFASIDRWSASAEALRLAAGMAEAGFGTPVSWAEAHERYTKACGKRDMRSCGVLARRAVLGRTPPDSAVQVEFTLKRYCESGEPNACATLGYCYASNSCGIAEDRNGGIRRLRRGCDKADGAPHCAMLARLRRLGVNEVTRDFEEANRLARRACELGDTEGCTEVALLLMERDEATGMAMLERTCDDVDAHACMELATRRKQSDPAGALTAFSRACAMGLSPGCDEASTLGGQTAPVVDEPAVPGSP